MSLSVPILVVEDEPLISMLAVDALTDGGFEVLVASDGSEALNFLRERDVRGLVTDIRLGTQPDGWQIAREARQQSPDMAVVYCTGDSAYEWPAQGVPNSMVIQKPYAAAQLVNAMTTLLAQADAARATSPPSERDQSGE